jgi:hypothetical protein
MNLTENKKIIHSIGYVAIALIIYISLVLIDYVASVYLQKISGGEAAQIEQKRVCDEDIKQIDEARTLGYQSVLMPASFGAEPYKSVAIRYQVAPLAPLPNENLYYCNEGYGQVRYKSDRYGFRNPDALWDMPLVDVMLIGDSFVHGACVSQVNSIAGALAKLGLASINLGTGGNAPIHYAAISKTFIRIKRERAVVIVFYPNDNLNNEESDIFYDLYFNKSARYFEASDPAFSPALSGNLISLYNESRELLKQSAQKMNEERSIQADECQGNTPLGRRVDVFWASAKKHLRFSSLARITREAVKSKFATEELPYGSRLAIDTLQNECKLNGCTPIVLYIPNSDFWKPDYRAKQYSLLLRNYVESHGMAFIDTTDELTKLGNAAYAAKGPHLSPGGYSKVARKIAEHLQHVR